MTLEWTAGIAMGMFVNRRGPGLCGQKPQKRTRLYDEGQNLVKRSLHSNEAIGQWKLPVAWTPRSGRNRPGGPCYRVSHDWQFALRQAK